MDFGGGEKGNLVVERRINRGGGERDTRLGGSFPTIAALDQIGRAHV